LGRKCSLKSWKCQGLNLREIYHILEHNQKMNEWVGKVWSKFKVVNFLRVKEFLVLKYSLEDRSKSFEIRCQY